MALVPIPGLKDLILDPLSYQIQVLDVLLHPVLIGVSADESPLFGLKAVEQEGHIVKQASLYAMPLSRKLPATFCPLWLLQRELSFSLPVSLIPRQQ